MDFQKSVVISVVLLLSFMLAGGFYVKRLPFWLHWYQYVSYITYVFDSLLLLEFTPDSHFAYVHVVSGTVNRGVGLGRILSVWVL